MVESLLLNTFNSCIRRITPDYKVMTIAGVSKKNSCIDGDVSQALFFHASSSDNGLTSTVCFYIFDSENYRIGKVLL